MEKKNRNCASNSTRPPQTDIKKNQDVAPGKSWPRNTKRREPPGPGFSGTKSAEPSRKPQPPRNGKTFDKRPKPRGFYYQGTANRNETACLENEFEPELGSVFVPGSKKQSLNHLLNFSYAPREGGYSESRNFSDNGKKTVSKMLTTKKHKYNKEHFLQANCQFVVNTSGDYKQYMNNPDALVDWNLIEQVNVQVSETPSCPICLYPPVAAKMTKCGHIYCWSCILHYLALSDKNWRKCPICFDSVNRNDLKSVTMIPYTTRNTNETITFNLMKRPRGCLTSYRADEVVSENDQLFNVADQSRKNVYSKLLLADKENILSIIEREGVELEVQLAQDENCPEKCFIEEAIALLKSRESKTMEMVGNKFKNSNKGTNLLDLVDSFEALAEDFDGLNVDSNRNDNISGIETNKNNPNNNTVNNAPIKADSGDTDLYNQSRNYDANESVEGGSGVNGLSKFHYFYQASDGQHLYLHAINARMLEHHYGSLENSPKTIKGKILEKEGGSMTEELRKRLRYLQHLSVTCQFEVAEIQFDESVVGKNTLEHFKEQIETRKKRRQRRAREEKRREKRIEAEENRKIGRSFNNLNLHLESHDQFPDVSESHILFPEIGVDGHRTRTESECTFPSERSISPDFSSSSNLSLDNATSSAGPSFATMLATEKKTPSWPNLKTPSTSSTDAAVKLIPVTGSKMTVLTRRRNQKNSDSDEEGRDFEPVPDFNRSFGDALALALAKSVDEKSDDPAVETGKKKKKKKQQKVLFATNMACTGN